MRIRATQRLDVEVEDYIMQEAVEKWLMSVVGIGEHDSVEKVSNAANPMLIRREDVGRHKTDYDVVETRKATPLEYHTFKVIMALRHGKLPAKKKEGKAVK